MRFRLVFLPILLAGLPLFAQRWIDQFYPKPIFHIKPEDEAKLTYFIIEDQFEDVFVSYCVGEFRLLFPDGTEKFIPLRYQPVPEEEGIPGLPSPGKDELLASYARTKTFTIPANATLFFYRSFFRSFPMEATVDFPDSLLRTWTDYFWMTAPGKILDTMIVTIELRRADDNAVLAILDSIGIFPDPHSWYIDPVGMEAFQTRHFRQLPAQYAGTSAYICIVPYRYGPTPYGLKLFRSWTWCSFSTLRDFDSASVTSGWQDWRITGAAWDSLYAAYYEQLRAYLDSGLAASGTFPPVALIYLPTDAIRADFFARYLDASSADPLQQAEYTAALLQKNAQQSAAAAPQQHSMTVRYYDLGTPTIELRISTPQTVPNAHIELINEVGQKVAELWQGEIPSGSFELKLPLSFSLAKGQYWVILRSSTGRIWGHHLQIP